MTDSLRHKVESFFGKHEKWIRSLTKFREILIQSGLKETVKWGMPVYTYRNKNVVGLGVFNSYVGLWFYQGVFLSDSAKLLINAQEGKTKAMRQLRFANEIEIDFDLVKSYIAEALQNQMDGKVMKPDFEKSLFVPEELLTALQNDPDLNTAFEAFTPGKKREFADYISEAKKPNTKQNRLKKVNDLIRQGIGLNDTYKK